MVRASIKTPRLNQALSAVTVVVDTAELQFGPDGLRVQTVDKANVGAVEMTLLSNAFEEFSGEDISFHVNLRRIGSIIQNLDMKQEITLVYEEQKPYIEINAGEYDFEFAKIDPDSVRSGKRATEISPPSKIEIKAEELARAISLAREFSEEVTLGISERNKEFYINSEGDVDKMAVSFDEADEVVDNMEIEEAHAVYNLDLLFNMVSQASSDKTLTLYLGRDYPAKVEFPIAGESGRITYGLAPRVAVSNR